MWRWRDNNSFHADCNVAADSNAYDCTQRISSLARDAGQDAGRAAVTADATAASDWLVSTAEKQLGTSIPRAISPKTKPSSSPSPRRERSPITATFTPT